MKVKINNVALELSEGATLQDALDAKNIPAKGIATAINGKVVPALLRGKKLLNEDDNIVIIKAFYGG
ncbi:MAG: sulfur carrier protein ThiS [Muribaculaceae bacterium]|nr:sulfur carrier protein ThiS [Muribaculaceae bacterium]